MAQAPDRLRRFEREAKTVAALNHPHILTVFDVGTHDGTPYVVTELLEGDTLPYEELMAKLGAFTSLEVVAEEAEPSGYRTEVSPFPGWKDVPSW